MVAISIPIFTSQLEKARRATTEANLRSAYAEASVALLDDESTTTGVTPNVTDGAGTITVTPVDIETVKITADNTKLPFTVDMSGITAAKKDATVTFTVANGEITAAAVK